MSRKRVLAYLVACLAYILLPTDLVPDYWPMVGWIDDLVALLATLYLIIRGRRPPPPAARTD